MVTTVAKNSILTREVMCGTVKVKTHKRKGKTVKEHTRKTKKGKKYFRGKKEKE